MELNREQIVKALEVCTTEEDCVGCPYLIRRGDGSILPCSIDADALALIRELTEENERLSKEVDRLSQVVLYHDSITEMEVAEAKADTVRKMQEMIKAICTVNLTAILRCVDQIAEELLEEET